MPNEQIRNQLMAISRSVYAAMEIINEKGNKERNDKLKQDIARTYYRDEANQRKEILRRRELIERYKEEKETESRNKVIACSWYCHRTRSISILASRT